MTTSPKITGRDKRFTSLIAQGFTAKEIAVKESTTADAIEGILERMRKRLGAKNNSHLVYIVYCGHNNQSTENSTLIGGAKTAV
jgi:DNA-binding CsgD family transcriptional regulator